MTELMFIDISHHIRYPDIRPQDLDIDVKISQRRFLCVLLHSADNIRPDLQKLAPNIRAQNVFLVSRKVLDRFSRIYFQIIKFLQQDKLLRIRSITLRFF